jgi:hypothetical protein
MAAPSAMIPAAPNARPNTNDKIIEITMLTHLILCAFLRHAGILAANIISTIVEAMASIIIIVNSICFSPSIETGIFYFL